MPCRRGFRAAGVAVAAVPVSTFVVNLVPWWRGSSPAVLFVGCAGRRRRPGDRGGAVGGRPPAGGGAARGGGAHARGARRRRAHRVGPAAGVGVRAEPGRRWPVLRAGQHQLRALRARRAGRRRVGGGLRALASRCGRGWRCVVLAAALAVEALPSLGADFGGPPGLLLGGLLVVATAAGVRLTWRRVLAAVVGAGALVALVAVADWLRPAGSRTHLGDFVESVVSGEAGAVRRAQAVAEPRQPRLTAPARHRRSPRWCSCVVALAGRGGGRCATVRWCCAGRSVMAVVGFLANDSGLVIPAFVALVLAPLLVAAGPSPQKLQVSRGTEGARR